MSSGWIEIWFDEYYHRIVLYHSHNVAEYDTDDGIHYEFVYNGRQGLEKAGFSYIGVL